MQAHKNLRINIFPRPLAHMVESGNTHHGFPGTECVTDLDLQRDMIIFESILTTFETSIVF